MSPSRPGPSNFLYRVYGLRLCSTDPLPGLPEVSRWPEPSPDSSPSPAADIQIHWGRLPPEAGASAEIWRRLYTSEDLDEEGLPVSVLDRADGPDPVLRLEYADGTCFWLKSGASEVWGSWPSTLTPEDASTYLLGPVLGYVLRLRGLQVLHGSAVTLAPVGAASAGAMALVGPPGAGKSTLAAAFLRRGHAVLTEDVCALCEAGQACGEAFGNRGLEAGVVEVLPGYPLVRLWSDSVEMLYGNAEALPLLTPTWDKRYLLLGQEGAEFCDEPLPLRSIVLLAPREETDAPRVEPVPPAQALIHLVGNTYKNLLLDRDQRIDEFRFLHRLLEAVPVRRAVPHTDPTYLDRLLDSLLESEAG